MAIIRRQHSYRSGFEDRIVAQLKVCGITGAYEIGRFPYTKGVSHYTPDFILPNGIVIETKGYFTPEDRTKHLLIKEQYPGLDLRFVFQNEDCYLNKDSSTTYGDWCKKHGFKYAEKHIPAAWIAEKTNKLSKAVIEKELIINSGKKSKKSSK